MENTEPSKHSIGLLWDSSATLDKKFNRVFNIP